MDPLQQLLERMKAMGPVTWPSSPAQAGQPPVFNAGAKIGAAGGDLMSRPQLTPTMPGAPKPPPISLLDQREGAGDRLGVETDTPHPREPSPDDLAGAIVQSLSAPTQVGAPPSQPIAPGVHGNLPGNGMLAAGGMPRPSPAPQGIPMASQKPMGPPMPPGMMPPPMPSMGQPPGADFSTMLNIARGGPGMGGMGAPPMAPPQQPFGKDELVSKAERPLGGILDKGWMGGDPKIDGGMLAQGGMPPPWLMNMFGGGFGGF